MIDRDRVQALLQQVADSTHRTFPTQCSRLFTYLDEQLTATNPTFIRYQREREDKWKDWGAGLRVGHGSFAFPDPDDCPSLAWDLYRSLSEMDDNYQSFLLAMYHQRHLSENLDAFRADWSQFLQEAIHGVLEHERSVGDCDDREKDQKFGILDAPSLLEGDLALAPGRLGRAVIYMDLDRFKAANTELTERVVDDLILPPIHRALRDCATGNGWVYAEGGDEFTVLLPNVSRAMAIGFSHALRHVIKSLRFDGAAAAFMFSASVGVAHDNSESHNGDLPGRANAAKKVAKEQGRDCVVEWSAQGSEIVTSITF